MGVIRSMSILVIGLYVLGSLSVANASLSYSNVQPAEPAFLKIANNIKPEVTVVDRCYPMDTTYPIFDGVALSHPSPCRALRSADLDYCRNFVETSVNGSSTNFGRLTTLLTGSGSSVPTSAAELEVLFRDELQAGMTGNTHAFNLIKEACEGHSSSPNDKCKLSRYDPQCTVGELLKSEFHLTTTEYQVTCKNPNNAPGAKSNGHFDDPMSCFNTENMYRVANWHWGRETNHASASSANTDDASHRAWDERACDSINMISGVTPTKILTRLIDSADSLTRTDFDGATAREYPYCFKNPMDASGDSKFVGSWVCDKTKTGSIGVDNRDCRVTEYNASIFTRYTPYYEAEAHDMTDDIEAIRGFTHQIRCAPQGAQTPPNHIPALNAVSEPKNRDNCPADKQNRVAYTRVIARQSGDVTAIQNPEHYPTAQCGYGQNDPTVGSSSGYNYDATSSMAAFVVPYQFATWRSSTTSVIEQNPTIPHSDDIKEVIEQVEDQVNHILNSSHTGTDGVVANANPYTYASGNLVIVEIKREAVLGSLREFLGGQWYSEIAQAQDDCFDSDTCVDDYTNFVDKAGPADTPYGGCFSGTAQGTSASPVYRTRKDGNLVYTEVKIPTSQTETLLHYSGGAQNKHRTHTVTEPIILRQEINRDQNKMLFSGSAPSNLKVFASSLTSTKYVKTLDYTHLSDSEYGQNDVSYWRSAETNLPIEWRSSIINKPSDQQKYVRLGMYQMEVDFKLQNAYAALTGMSGLKASWVGANADTYNAGDCSLTIGYVPAAVTGGVDSSSLLRLCNNPATLAEAIACGPMLFRPDSQSTVFPYPVVTETTVISELLNYLIPSGSDGKNADYHPTCASCNTQVGSNNAECSCRIWKQRFRFDLHIFFRGACNLGSDTTSATNPLLNANTQLQVSGFLPGNEFNLRLQVVPVRSAQYDTAFTRSQLKVELQAGTPQDRISPKQVNIYNSENFGNQVAQNAVNIPSRGINAYQFSTIVKIGHYKQNTQQLAYMNAATQEPVLYGSHNELVSEGAITFESSNAHSHNGVTLSLGATVTHINNVEPVNMVLEENIEACALTPKVHLMCAVPKSDTATIDQLNVRAVTTMTDQDTVSDETATMVQSTRCLSAAMADDEVWVLYFNHDALDEGLSAPYSAEQVLCNTEPFRTALCASSDTLKPTVQDLTVGRGRYVKSPSDPLLTTVAEVKQFTEDQLAPMWPAKYAGQMDDRGDASADVATFNTTAARAARSMAFTFSQKTATSSMPATNSDDLYLGDLLQAYQQYSSWETASGTEESLTCMDGVVSVLPTLAARNGVDTLADYYFMSEFFSDVDLTLTHKNNERRSVHELLVNSQVVEDVDQPQRRAPAPPAGMQSADGASSAQLQISWGLTGSEITQGPGGNAHVECHASQYINIRASGASTGVCVDVSDGSNRTFTVMTPSVSSQAEVSEVDDTTKENRILLLVLLVVLGVVVVIVSVVGVVQMRMHRMTWHLNAMLSTPGYRTRGAQGEAESTEKPSADNTLAATLVSSTRKSGPAAPATKATSVPMKPVGASAKGDKAGASQPAKGRVLI